MKNQNGNALIPIIITISIALISVFTLANGGIFVHAQDATSKWEEKKEQEQNSAGSSIIVKGKTYNSIEEYLDEIEETTQP